MRPSHISSIIWLVIAIMAILSLLVPESGFHIGDQTLRWPTLASIFNSPTVQDTVTVTDTHTTTVASTPVATPATTPVATPAATPADSTIATNDSAQSVCDDSVKFDTRIYLSRFYASLSGTDTSSVRIVHYGDSQIEEDRISRSLRQHMQGRYGGGGAGLIPLHQTIPSATVRQRCYIRSERQATSAGPKRYLVYGVKQKRGYDNFYGPMGQVAMMADSCVSGSDTITILVTPFGETKKHAHYFNRVRLFADNVSGYVTIDKHKYTLTSDQIAILPDSTQRCNMTFYGQGRVYGISLETPTGVHVDNIPMRGSSGLILTNISKSQLSNYFAATNTRLIIMQFGGNWMPHAKSKKNIENYITSMRQQIRYMRSCAPDADILFIGPSDMSTKVNGVLTTYPLLPTMDKELFTLACSEKIAYWSMYNAMGGKNSMIRWRKSGLCGNDYVHFTPRGADKVGDMLSQWITEPLESNASDSTSVDSDTTSQNMGTASTKVKQ